MQEIAIKNLNNLQELDIFIAQTNDKVDNVKSIVVANDDDIKLISKDIKVLKDREDTLKVAEGKLIELVGINRIGEAIDNSKKHRLLANSKVKNAKQKIKDDAVNYFVEKATETISKSQAQESYKTSFDLKQMALDAITGKSTNFKKILDAELVALGLRLDDNARATQEKLAIIKQYTNDLTRDLDALLKMPREALKPILDGRQVEKDNEIKAEAERLAEIERAKAQAEAERVAEIEAEAERVAQAEAQAKAKAGRLAEIERAKASSNLPASASEIKPENAYRSLNNTYRSLKIKKIVDDFRNDLNTNLNKDKIVFGQYEIYLNGAVYNTTNQNDIPDCILKVRNFLLANKKEDK